MTREIERGVGRGIGRERHIGEVDGESERHQERMAANALQVVGAHEVVEDAELPQRRASAADGASAWRYASSSVGGRGCASGAGAWSATIRT